MTQKTMHQGGYLPLTPETLYNYLMKRIEPDLTLENIPLLAKKYADESREETLKRLERYKEALQEYGKQFSTWLSRMEPNMKKAFRGAKMKIEEASKTEDIEAIESILSDYTEDA